MKIRIGIAIACLLAASTACSTQTPGEATPVGGAQPPASQPAGNHPEVRKVTQPLDASKFETDPCGLVPKDVLVGLTYPNPGKMVPKSEALSGPYCGWNSSKLGDGLTVTIQTGNRDRGIGGLAGLYTGHDSGQMPFLEPALDVSGYQAVYADLQDRRGRGACNLHVGIADDLDFSVGTQGYDGQQDSCDAARQVAAAVVTTLKEA